MGTIGASGSKMKKRDAQVELLQPIMQAMRDGNLSAGWKQVRKLRGSSADIKKALTAILTAPRFAEIAQAAAEPYARLLGDQALPQLWQCVRHPRNRKRRGGFVHAMWNLDWSGYWRAMTDLTVDTSFEVRDLARHAILLRWKDLPIPIQRNIHQRLIEFCYDSDMADEPRQHMMQLLKALNRKTHQARRQTLRAAS